MIDVAVRILGRLEKAAPELNVYEPPQGGF